MTPRWPSAIWLPTLRHMAPSADPTLNGSSYSQALSKLPLRECALVAVCMENKIRRLELTGVDGNAIAIITSATPKPYLRYAQVQARYQAWRVDNDQDGMDPRWGSHHQLLGRGTYNAEMVHFHTGSLPCFAIARKSPESFAQSTNFPSSSRNYYSLGQIKFDGYFSNYPIYSQSWLQRLHASRELTSKLCWLK
jgi:hypothetical protein